VHPRIGKGSGPAHANATKAFVNWLLSREGQEIVSRALGQSTRRLDVDTKWLRDTGVIPAKDHMSVEEFLQVETNRKRSSIRFASRRKGLLRQY
jgi:ABC-type Fe3+ transport system substrate-binding protein